MAAIAAPFVTSAVSAASGNTLTVTSTTSIYPGQIGRVTASGQTTLRIMVTKIVSATVFAAKIYPRIDDANFHKGTGNPGPGQTAADLSAYNGGNVYFDSQVVPVQGDYTKFPSYGAA